MTATVGVIGGIAATIVEAEKASATAEAANTMDSHLEAAQAWRRVVAATSGKANLSALHRAMHHDDANNRLYCKSK